MCIPLAQVLIKMTQIFDKSGPNVELSVKFTVSWLC